LSVVRTRCARAACRGDSTHPAQRHHAQRQPCTPHTAVSSNPLNLPWTNHPAVAQQKRAQHHLPAAALAGAACGAMLSPPSLTLFSSRDKHACAAMQLRCGAPTCHVLCQPECGALQKVLQRDVLMCLFSCHTPANPSPCICNHILVEQTGTQAQQQTHTVLPPQPCGARYRKVKQCRGAVGSAPTILLRLRPHMCKDSLACLLQGRSGASGSGLAHQRMVL
jgi:hypothetical protein